MTNHSERRLEFKKGDIVLKENEEGDYFYFVTSGKLAVYKDYAGKKIPVAEVHELQAIGEMSLIDRKHRSATAVALTDVQVLKITKAAIDKQISECPLWFQVIIKNMVERLRMTDDIVKRNNIHDSELIEIFGAPYKSSDEKIKVSGQASDLVDDTEVNVSGSFEELSTDKAQVKGAFNETDNEKIVISGQDDAKNTKNPLLRVLSKQSVVLIADQDANFVKSFSLELKKEGVQTITCSKADEAIMKLSNQYFACLFINLDLKQGKGEGVIRHIRQLSTSPNHDTPIFLVCNDENKMRVEMIQSLINGVLVKPVNYSEFIEKLKTARK